MTRSRRIQPVQRLSEFREREAAKKLAELLQQKERNQKKLGELLSYQQQSVDEQAADCAAGISVASLQAKRIFMQKLTLAISLQRQHVGDLDQQIMQQITQWKAARGYTQVLQELVERYRSEEYKLLEKRLEREIEDNAPRGPLNGRSG